MLTIILGALAMYALYFLFSRAYKLAISLAPLFTAIMLGTSLEHFHGWFAFFFWVVLLYSAMSYPKLRKAIVYSSSVFAALFVLVLVGGLIQTVFSSNPTIQFILAIAVCIYCMYLSLRADDEIGISIPLSKILPLPIPVQRIIASFLYGFSTVMMCALVDAQMELSMLGEDTLSVILQWGVVILIAVAVFFGDIALTAYRNGQAAVEEGNG